MNTTDTAFRKKLMRRIYGVYFARAFMKPRTHFLGSAALLLVLAAFISVKDIAKNALAASATPDGFIQYTLDAFMSADTIVLILTVLAAAFVLFAVRDACLYCLSTGSVLLKKQTRRAQ